VAWAALTSRSTKVFYDRIASVYDEVFVDHRVHAETIADLLSARHAGRERETLVLDLGCGTGMLTGVLATRGFVVVGVDISLESLLAHARRRPRSALVQADAECLPMADSCVHDVVCLGAWRHFPRPRKVLGEIGRVLARDGRLVIGYFPPALAGALHLRRSGLSGLLIRWYAWLTGKLGYADRADFALEDETIAAASKCFRDVGTVESGGRWRLIVAQDPLPPAPVRA
jgi:ubiquinone/menaquinone biosynthesis C-methylase UbiE